MKRDVALITWIFHPLFTYPRLYPLKILFTYENTNDIITCQWYTEYKISTVLETSGKYFFNVFILKFFLCMKEWVLRGSE